MTRNFQQNRFYRAVCNDVAEFLNLKKITYKVDGVDYAFDGDRIHKFNKIKFKIKTTTTMSVKEFIDYTDEVIAFWQEETNYEWDLKNITKGCVLWKTG